MKRILVAADMTTHPCVGGNNQCVMQYVSTLKNLGFDVYYLLIGVEGLSEETIQATKEYWGDHLFLYKTPKSQVFIQKVIRRILRKTYPPCIDFYSPLGIVKYVNTLQNKYNFSGLIVNYIWQSKLAECDIPVKALYTHDVFSYRDERMKAGANWHNYPVSIEAKGIRRFKNVLAIQDVERDFFKYLSPRSNVVSVYTGFEFIDQPIVKNKNILFFSGGGDLNLSGIRRFLDKVWPLFHETDSEIKLLIGGNICKSLDEESIPEGVALMGRYDDVSDFYAQGNIVINPVFEGSGLKIKTFEAVAHGKTTIVDPHSMIGIFDRENNPLLVAQTPDDYVRIILSRLDNPELLEKDKQVATAYIKRLNHYISNQYSNIFNTQEQCLT